MSWRSILVKDGEYLKLKLDNIVIFKDDFEYTVPLSDISIVVIEGMQTNVTTRLLAAFSKYNVGLVICDHKYTPVGIYHSFNQHSRASKVFQKQLEWDILKKGNVWKLIIQHKINNQKEVLEYLRKDRDSINKLNEYRKSIEHYDHTNREGHAAKVYFNTLFGNDFTRQDDDSVVNAGLNYGYAIVRAQLARLVVASGLQPMIGLFHKSEYNAFNLVDDLIEPFRPFIDVWVYNNIRNEKFLTFEHRVSLIDLLNQRAVYKGGKYTLTVIMEKYLADFIKSMEINQDIQLENPILKSFEGCRDEV